MLVGNRDFVAQVSGRDQAGAARDPQGGRPLRHEPERVARSWSTSGFTTRYDYRAANGEGGAVRPWRDYDPEDTIRFYALRLHEAG